MEYLDKLINHMCPYVRRAWDGVLPVNWYMPERIIFDFEIMYIMEGQAEIIIEDTKYTANPGDLFFFRPLKRHSIQSINNTNLRQPHVHFDFYYQDDSEEVYIPYWPMKELGEDIKYARVDITGSIFLNIPNKIVLKNPSAVEELLFKIIRNTHNTTFYSNLISKASMLELIAIVLNELDNMDDEQDNDYMQVNDMQIERMEVSRNYIIKNYNVNLSLEQISNAAGFSKNHFSKLFKSLYKITPMQYHTHIRFERAKNMLMASDDSIIDISKSLGFESIHHFSRSFKNFTGYSPRYFRQIHDKE